MKKWPFFLFVIFVIIIWEIFIYWQLLPASLFPPPSQMLKAFQESPTEFITAFSQTALHSLDGLLISLIVGSSLSMLLSLSENLKNIFLPLSIFFQTIPIIAIAPLLVIYFGFGSPTVVAASSIVCFFPVMASFLLGLQSVEKEKLELFQLYGASPLQTLFKLRLPNAFLALYSGLKVATGLAVIGSVAGEFVAGSGLGSLIDSSRTAQRVDRVYAALILLALMGLLFLGILRFIFKMIYKWKPYGPVTEEWS